MAAYVFPAIPELTGKEAADFIRKAEKPAVVQVSAQAEAIYKKLTEQLSGKKT